MIKVQNVTYKYPGCGKSVLFDFSASFKRGAITAVRGKNGCGKTTLTKLIAGMLRPNSGSIHIDGTDIARLNLFEIGQRAGYVFENHEKQLFCDTVYKEVSYSLVNMGLPSTQVKERTESFIKYFGLERYRDVFPGRLSFGEKQRLALAAVLALETPYLILDEPAACLDAYRMEEFGRLLHKIRAERDCGIILVSHDKDFCARFADRELVMTP